MNDTTPGTAPVPITVARGDGIGPEIMQATLHVLQGAGARLAIEEIEIGEAVYNRGISAGIEDSSWESLRRTKVFLKAPITTPQGGGFKSLNVTARKTLGLFANIRPCRSYHPFVETKHPVMDVVIVRENEEDLYAGIEYRQTRDVELCLKLITRPGCEKICRYAFEYARANHRKKVTCFTKDNIMKRTDGLFHRVFDEVAGAYPEIETEHWIVDIGAAKLADTPELFDVLVMPNLYGDILSDVAAQIAGSVGLAGSANIGELCAMFEAIHGSAPRRAGQNVANPSGLLLGSVLMLQHIGQGDVAQRVHNAWLRALEDGQHTYDVWSETHSRDKLGTQEFAQAVVDRLGQEPETLAPVRYAQGGAGSAADFAGMKWYDPATAARPVKELAGVDLFLHWDGNSPGGPGLAAQSAGELAARLEMAAGAHFRLSTISNRGVKVWPHGFPDTFTCDQWICRFMRTNGEPAPSAAADNEHPNTAGTPLAEGEQPLTGRELGNEDAAPPDGVAVAALLGRVAELGLDCVRHEGLYNFDGERGYSLGQGE
jgi:isocitrate dehydrogenase